MLFQGGLGHLWGWMTSGRGVDGLGRPQGLAQPLYWICFTWLRIGLKSSLEKITLLLKMSEKHWCFRRTHKGLESQRGLGDGIPTKPLDLGKPQDLSHPMWERVTGLDRTRVKTAGPGQILGRCLPSSCFLGLPKLGPKNSHARSDGLARLTPHSLAHVWLEWGGVASVQRRENSGWY